MKIGSIFISFLLFASIFILVSTGANSSFADDSSESMGTVAVEGTGSTGNDEITAASGSNRFVVWVDDTPGNFEIFFARSTNNGAIWQPTKNLSANPGLSNYPAIAVAGSNVYVVWRQENAAETVADVYFRRSTDNGATWGPKIKISSDGSTWFDNPRISASATNVYIIWNDSIDSPECDSRSCYSGGEFLFRRSTDSGKTWGAVKELGGSDAGAHEFVVQGSNLYVIWSATSEGEDSADGQVSFIRSTDGGATWKSAVILQNAVNSSDCYSSGIDCHWYNVRSVQLAAAGSNVYAMWSFNSDESSETSDVMFRRSLDGGATWKSMKNLSANAGYSTADDLAVSGSNVFAVWTDATPGNLDIFVRRSVNDGATWQATKNLSNNPGHSSFPDISVSGSNFYVAWYQVNAAETLHDILFKRSTDNGATWKASVNISNMNAGQSLFPEVAVSGSNLYIGWMDDTPGNFDTLFRRSLDSGATWQPIKNLSSNSGFSSSPKIGV